MATTSPPPTSTTSAVSPAPPPPPPPSSSGSPSPSTSSLPETSINSSTSQTNPSAPSTSTPPPQLAPPPAVSAASPPSKPSTPPPQTPITTSSPETSPPPPPPPSSAADPPSTPNPPPPSSQSSTTPVSSPPSTSPPPPSPPPPSSTPPTNSPPPPSPPSSTPPTNSPPPPSLPLPSSTPPTYSPPPSPTPPTPSPPPSPSLAPPPQSPSPPQSSTPATPSTPPPQNSPPPPVPNRPTSSPPPPASVPPHKSSPPPPAATPLEKSPPPPSSKVPSPSYAPPPPSSNHTPVVSTLPPTVIRLSPPPPSPISPSTSPPSSVNNTTPVSLSPASSGGIGTGGLVAIGVGVGIVVLSIIGMIACCLRKQRRDASGLEGGYVLPSPSTSDSIFSKMQSMAPLMGNGSRSGIVYSPSEPGGLGNSRSWFTFEELAEVTNGFSSKNLLGEGGFGSVYKGYLPDGRVVAVKQLKIGGGQGEREFKAEVEIISRIHHRHLVSLVGYCISENRRLLVYEYVPNNTLYFHLHGEGRPVLDWETRVKIAAGAARGIAYLHEDCHPRIIHRDIKSLNILLDNNYEAKVSDFGLAKLALDANTHVTTRVMGTFGYMAPEYASSGKLTEKSDVFSYGVVLLELITGRKPVDPSQPLGDESLVEWARPLLSYALDNEEFDGLVDPRLEKNYVESEMYRIIEAAAACVRHSAAKRPRMGQVVRAFDSLVTADLTNGMRVGESEVLNSAEQSAQIRLFRRMAFGSQNYSSDFFSQCSLGSREYARSTSREQYRSSIGSGVGQIKLEP